MKTNSFLRLVKKPKFILLKLAKKSSFPLSDELFYELCYEYILGSKLYFYFYFTDCSKNRYKL